MKEEIKEFVREPGGHVFGIAGAEDFAEAPQGFKPKRSCLQLKV